MGEGLSNWGWPEQHVEDFLRGYFGESVHFWPTPDLTSPRWWQRKAKRKDEAIRAALACAGFDPLTQEQRRTFWHEVRKGQDVCEDAGGYFWRCWAVMLGLRAVVPVNSYAAEIERLMQPREPLRATESESQ